MGVPYRDGGYLYYSRTEAGEQYPIFCRRKAFLGIGPRAASPDGGAVVNQRPDLLRAVVAQVPFLDVLNTILDESLPLTVGEFEEWGNPKVEAEYRVMRSYSPYDNVAAKAYPAMLVTSSYNDSQVMYWEPAKWVARLRATKTDANPLLLHVNMEAAGHGGKSGRYDRLREIAIDQAFLLWQLGVEPVVVP